LCLTNFLKEHGQNKPYKVFGILWALLRKHGQIKSCQSLDKMWQGHITRDSSESALFTWFTNQIFVGFFVGFAFHLEVFLVQRYVIKFVNDLRQVGRFLRVFLFPPPIKLPRYNWNIVESGIKHHNPNYKVWAKTQVKNNISTAQRKIT